MFPVQTKRTCFTVRGASLALGRQAKTERFQVNLSGFERPPSAAQKVQHQTAKVTANDDGYDIPFPLYQPDECDDSERDGYPINAAAGRKNHAHPEPDREVQDHAHNSNGNSGECGSEALRERLAGFPASLLISPFHRRAKGNHPLRIENGISPRPPLAT